MQTIMVRRIIDDNGAECKVGDKIMIRTTAMEETMPAVIDTIMMQTITVIVENRFAGYVPLQIPVKDVKILYRI